MPVKRRDLGNYALASVVFALTPSFLRSPFPFGEALLVDSGRLNRRLSTLAQFSSSADGTTRLAYSDEDLAAREWVTEILHQLGTEVSVDLGGNLLAYRHGSDPSAPPIMLGSHIDSVPALSLIHI